MDGLDALALAAAGFAAGAINGAAGGGTLVAYPVLLATGASALVANVTTSVGIWPGYVGGAAGFRDELQTQRHRVRQLGPVAAAGGLVGAVLLLVTPEDLFEGLAPVLVLAACALFAAQPLLQRRVASRRHDDATGASPVPRAAVLGTLLASVYGGYFGAGLGVILLAILGTVLTDRLVRINGLRSVLSLVVSSLSVVIFVVGAEVDWGKAGILAATSLVGGYAGARVARRLPTVVLRGVVLAFGLLAAARLLTS